jgi:chemotaxis protein histidine kinase CheA
MTDSDTESCVAASGKNNKNNKKTAAAEARREKRADKEYAREAAAAAEARRKKEDAREKRADKEYAREAAAAAEARRKKEDAHEAAAAAEARREKPADKEHAARAAASASEPETDTEDGPVAVAAAARENKNKNKKTPAAYEEFEEVESPYPSDEPAAAAAAAAAAELPRDSANDITRFIEKFEERARALMQGKGNKFEKANQFIELYERFMQTIHLLWRPGVVNGVLDQALFGIAKEFNLEGSLKGDHIFARFDDISEYYHRAFASYKYNYIETMMHDGEFAQSVLAEYLSSKRFESAGANPAGSNRMDNALVENTMRQLLVRLFGHVDASGLPAAKVNVIVVAFIRTFAVNSKSVADDIAARLESASDTPALLAVLDALIEHANRAVSKGGSDIYMGSDPPPFLRLSKGKGKGKKDSDDGPVPVASLVQQPQPQPTPLQSPPPPPPQRQQQPKKHPEYCSVCKGEHFTSACERPWTEDDCEKVYYHIKFCQCKGGNAQRARILEDNKKNGKNGQRLAAWIEKHPKKGDKDESKGPPF